MFRFCLAHLHAKCRRKVILEYFEESHHVENVEVMGQCCDVCSQSDSIMMINCEKEMTAIMQTVKEIPSMGEKKVGKILLYV